MLAPFVKTAGWLSYGEKTSSPLHVPTLIAHKALILALSSICSNLSFTKETVTDAFVDIASEKKFSVLSTDALKTEWCESMSAQLRTACRHVAHARVQTKTPKWLEHLDGLRSLGTEPATDDSAAQGFAQTQGEGPPPDDGQGPPPDDGQEVPHSNLDLATSKDSVVMLCAC